MELHALGRDLIQGRCFDVGVAVGAEEGVAVVIAQEEEDVGLCGEGRRGEGEQ